MIELTEEELREVNGGGILSIALIKKGITLAAGTALAETTRRFVSDLYDSAKNWLFSDDGECCEC